MNAGYRDCTSDGGGAPTQNGVLIIGRVVLDEK